MDPVREARPCRDCGDVRTSDSPLCNACQQLQDLTHSERNTPPLMQIPLHEEAAASNPEDGGTTVPNTPVPGSPVAASGEGMSREGTAGEVTYLGDAVAPNTPVMSPRGTVGLPSRETTPARAGKGKAVMRVADDDAEKEESEAVEVEREASVDVETTKASQPVKVRYGAACPDCKRSKIRCKHRAELKEGEIGNPPGRKRGRQAKSTASKSETARLAAAEPAKRELRTRFVDTSAEPLSAPMKTRGRPRKRKSPERSEAEVVEDAEAERPPSPKRLKRRGAITAGDSLDIAAQLVTHHEASKKLGEQLQELSERWEEVSDVVLRIQELLRLWLEKYQRGM
ncbi:hypothetical protein BDV25DRAFT_143625 [Aspergillus avenaceus]|uniref:Uncharacterized protein n=1 Tax=Aspergillus avenaceus TaxID=36643 RepID=A0A5N6TJK0_ASPAV|nr:hypothetical protein BDV25DRAFT_143625 [Aspergillus avenaceus]